MRSTSDRMIGMVLLKPGWEHDYEGRPPVYPIGCSGVITHVERLTDGRYNIVLRGSSASASSRRITAARYRRALVEPLLERALVRRGSCGPAAAAVQARGAARPGDRAALEPRTRDRRASSAADAMIPSEWPTRIW